MFPSLATMKAMLISFQCRSQIEKMFPSNGVRTDNDFNAGLTAKKFKQVMLKELLFAANPCPGLSFEFLHPRRPNKLLSYTKQLFFLPFCRRRHLKSSNAMFTFYMHCVEPRGRENANILPQTSPDISIFINAYVARLFSETVFPRLATGAAKHFVCFPLI